MWNISLSFLFCACFGCMNWCHSYSCSLFKNRIPRRIFPLLVFFIHHWFCRVLSRYYFKDYSIPFFVTFGSFRLSHSSWIFPPLLVLLVMFFTVPSGEFLLTIFQLTFSCLWHSQTPDESIKDIFLLQGSWLQYFL